MNIDIKNVVLVKEKIYNIVILIMNTTHQNFQGFLLRNNFKTDKLNQLIKSDFFEDTIYFNSSNYEDTIYFSDLNKTEQQNLINIIENQIPLEYRKDIYKAIKYNDFIDDCEDDGYDESSNPKSHIIDKGIFIINNIIFDINDIMYMKVISKNTNSMKFRIYFNNSNYEDLEIDEEIYLDIISEFVDSKKLKNITNLKNITKINN